MAKRISNQLSLDFKRSNNHHKEIQKTDVPDYYSTPNVKAKIIEFDSRRDIYRRILNRLNR